MIHLVPLTASPLLSVIAPANTLLSNQPSLLIACILSRLELSTHPVMPANAPLAGRFEEDPRVHFDKTAGKFQYEDEDTGKEYEWTGQVWVELVSVAQCGPKPSRSTVAMRLLTRTRWMKSSGRLSKRPTPWPAWTSRSVATQCRIQPSDAAPDARQRGARQRGAPKQEA